jgi:hypothetical protein
MLSREVVRRDPALRLRQRVDPARVTLFRQESLAAGSWVLAQQEHHFAPRRLLFLRVLLALGMKTRTRHRSNLRRADSKHRRQVSDQLTKVLRKEKVDLMQPWIAAA